MTTIRRTDSFTVPTNEPHQLPPATTPGPTSRPAPSASPDLADGAAEMAIAQGGQLPSTPPPHRLTPSSMAFEVVAQFHAGTTETLARAGVSPTTIARFSTTFHAAIDIHLANHPESAANPTALSGALIAVRNQVTPMVLSQDELALFGHHVVHTNPVTHGVAPSEQGPNAVILLSKEYLSAVALVPAAGPGPDAFFALGGWKQYPPPPVAWMDASPLPDPWGQRARDIQADRATLGMLPLSDADLKQAVWKTFCVDFYPPDMQLPGPGVDPGRLK